MSDRERFAAAFFRGYKRWVSPVFHGVSLTQCRYLPTCSEYAYAAVVRYGWMRGLWLAMKRVARCHPLAKGGLDPLR